jgi:hypothetical protein
MLDPIAVEFDEEAHQYFLPSGERLAYSVTQVCAWDMTDQKRTNIHRTRDQWALRGPAVHRAMEAFLTDGKEEALLGAVFTPKVDKLDFKEWIVPLLELEMWKDLEPLLVEGRLYDAKKSIGGSCDLLAKHKKTGKVTLFDLKTQSSQKASVYDISRQLGGYSCMIHDHYGVEIDEARGIWCRPGKTFIGKNLGVQHCINEWLGAYDCFKLTKPRF